MFKRQKRNVYFALIVILGCAAITPVQVHASNHVIVKTTNSKEGHLAPLVRHDLSELSVNTINYRFWDCNKIDWCWQPQGSYKNNSKTSTITYLEVVYGISANGGKELLFVNKMKANIRPGKSVRMFTGKYNKSFVLSFFDSTASSIGTLLGSSYVDWTHGVRYLEFSDGTSIGKKVNS